MKCPVCTSYHALQLLSMSDGLRLHQCPSCQGRWIRSDDYWRWRSSGEHPAASSVDPPQLADEGQPEIRFCPEDGYLLARFEVGAEPNFWIDQCRNCSGVWLDGGEWEHLVHEGLSDRLHLILSPQWQDEIRKARREETEQKQWLRQLGEEDLGRIAEIKEWLDGHPKRSQLYAYLRFHERAV